ncbi:hypothetical protein GCM10028824_27790 [Hymenobacter segetis]|uniref:DUF4359 domain-containing protein n=1 Tax=Hymenobacter segetis TaxID=2025509 RepID=A0ABU9LWI6_9BACT
MQALPGLKQLRWQISIRASLLMLILAAVEAVGGGLVTARQGAETGRPLSQGQAAGQFLRAVLRANYSAAYSRLAPEIRQGIGLARFTAAARPLWKSGQRPGRGTAIELYKLGVRLGDRGSARLFYSFSFAADSSLRIPSELLEVTFRDTASRAVLGFSLRLTEVARPKKQVVKKSQSR